MSKEREYYRKVIREYYEPINTKRIAGVVLGAISAMAGYKVVKEKLNKAAWKKKS